MKAVLLGLLLHPALAATALEAADTRGLAVKVERMPEPVVVDGLALRITRAAGPDAPSLARRVQERWRFEGSAVQIQQQQGWQMASRLQRGGNEVIQWRGSGDAAQLVHSLLDTRQAARRTSVAPFALPESCAWGRRIEGAAGRFHYEQVSGRCLATAAAVIGRLQLRLQAQGWRLSGQATTGWELDRSGIHGRLTLAEGPEPGQCSVVWIGVRRIGDTQP